MTAHIDRTLTLVGLLSRSNGDNLPECTTWSWSDRRAFDGGSDATAESGRLARPVCLNSIVLIDNKQLYLASEVMLYPLLACAKCAAAMLVILIQTLHSLWTFWIICGFVTTWAIAAVCLIPSQCRPVPWTMGPTEHNTCINQYSAQIGIKAVDIITDVVLAVLPGFLFMRLQMHRSKRLLVATLFGLRIMYDETVIGLALQELT